MFIVWYLENIDKYKKNIKIFINIFLYNKYYLIKLCLIFEWYFMVGIIYLVSFILLDVCVIFNYVFL